MAVSQTVIHLNVHDPPYSYVLPKCNVELQGSSTLFKGSVTLSILFKNSSGRVSRSSATHLPSGQYVSKLIYTCIQLGPQHRVPESGQGLQNSQLRFFLFHYKT